MNTRKTDYLHTVEEIVDVKIMVEYMKIIFSVKEDDMKYKEKKKKCTPVDYITTLCNCQKDISKFLRRSNMRKRCEKTIPVLNYITEDLVQYYRIKKKDLEKIESIKMARLEDCLLHNKIRQVNEMTLYIVFYIVWIILWFVGFFYPNVERTLHDFVWISITFVILSIPAVLIHLIDKIEEYKLTVLTKGYIFKKMKEEKETEKEEDQLFFFF